MLHNNANQAGVSRRSLLKGMGILSFAAMTSSLFPAIKAQAQAMSDSGFLPLSAFLVSREVNPVLGQRYYATLQKHYADFPSRLAALGDYVNAHNFKHVDDFLASLSADDPRLKTASLVISAWYTGVVGEGEHLELIAYADALMYLPTRGILVVPSYGGGPDSWGSKPAASTSVKGVNA